MKISKFFDLPPQGEPSQSKTIRHACPVCNCDVILTVPPGSEEFPTARLGKQVACESCVILTRKESALQSVLSRVRFVLDKKRKERGRLLPQFDESKRDVVLEAKHAALASEISQLEQTEKKGAVVIKEVQNKIAHRRKANETRQTF